MFLTIEIADADLEHLDRLVGAGPFDFAGDLRELVERLVAGAADGVRRPGSWERGWIQQATGADLA